MPEAPGVTKSSEVHGLAHRTQSGELSISAIRLPEIVSPCLQTLPMGLSNPETKIKNRHTDFLVNPRAAQLLRLRAGIIQHLRHLLEAQGHVEVQTPILGDGAGGALARSFTTSATEFPHRTINLRISPELWLKRLVVGGFDRVFEIGPSFRNEGAHHHISSILTAMQVLIASTIRNLRRVNSTEPTATWTFSCLGPSHSLKASLHLWKAPLPPILQLFLHLEVISQRRFGVWISFLASRML